MNSWHKQAIQHKSVISWLLVIAVLFIAILPSRFYFHHQNTENIVSHEQAVHSHFSTNETFQAHEKEGAVSFTLSALDKKNNPTFADITFISIFLVLLPLLRFGRKIRTNVNQSRFNNLYYFISPPLRAPPQP